MEFKFEVPKGVKRGERERERERDVDVRIYFLEI